MAKCKSLVVGISPFIRIHLPNTECLEMSLSAFLYRYRSYAQIEASQNETGDMALETMRRSTRLFEDLLRLNFIHKSQIARMELEESSHSPPPPA